MTYYDQKARPIYVLSTNEYLDTVDKIETKLDFVGRVRESKATHTKGSNAPIVTVDTFTYDHMGRLLTQKQQINNQGVETIVANTYDQIGQLETKEVGGGLQEVDYTYNVRGWLTEINDVDAIGNDLFSFKINYNQTSLNGSTALYNGNISETHWKTANDLVARNYKYSYDALNRINSATDNANQYSLSSVGYDKNGNILNLLRRGQTNSNATSFGIMDNLGYTYDAGNKLSKVVDNGNDSYGFKDGTNTNDDFVYDDNGNMTLDRNKGISSISYNHLNLPETLTINNTQGTGNISYIYDATGAKLKKIVSEGSSLTETEYAGNYIYKNGNLEFFNHPEGYVEPEDGGSFSYIYQLKDHLGNIRISFADKDRDGHIDVLRNNTDQDGDGDLAQEILQEKNYYPFGLKHKGYNQTITGREHNYGFGGKEEQDELGLGWIDITARNYDPAIGRWMNIDPLAEQMRRHSPYSFGFDNPIYFQDYDGMMPTGPGDPPTGAQRFIEGVKSVWNFFTNSRVSTGDKVKTAMEAVLPDKLALATLDGMSEVLPSSNLEVNLNYDGEFIKEAVEESLSIVPLFMAESTAVNVERKAQNLAKSKGRKVNIYGEGETKGFDDFAVDPDFSVGGNGITRQLTSTLENGSASEIVINNSPLNANALNEISRLSTSGTKITISGPVDSKFFNILSDHLGDTAKTINNSNFTKTFEGFSVEMKSTTFQIK